MVKPWRPAVLALVLGAACRKAEPPPPPVAPPATPDLTPITAPSGPLELAAGDGTDHDVRSVAAYKQTYGAAFRARHAGDGLVTIEHFPPGLSAGAWAGINLVARDRNVSWVVDGDAAHGYTLIYDENANGDLRDDPRHPFTAGEITLSEAMTDPDTHARVPIQHRLRVKDGKLFVQDQLIRRGTITVDGVPRAFTLVASGGDFHFPVAQLVIDLDGNGVAGPFSDVQHETPETIYLFERTVNVGPRSFEIQTDLGGAALTLTPLATPRPPRPSLAVGSPAPELAGTDLEGHAVALSALRGKTVLVDFWATWCEPCRQALPTLADLYRRRHPEGLEVLSIADGERDEVVKLLGAPPYPGHAVVDTQLGLTYRVFGYPSYFIVDGAGTIACARCQLDDVLARLDHASIDASGHASGS
ncbi:MAG TPA: TlpA disulfide reductase family protein [Kofleriaceae bacterium]|nr:TlpA disulfide reductase family protein [Kofleriaceae bacterium]